MDLLLEAGRKAAPETVNAELAGLAQDPRFKSVVRLLQDQQDQWELRVIDEQVVSDPGLLARAAGGLTAIKNTLWTLELAIDPQAQHPEQN